MQRLLGVLECRVLQRLQLKVLCICQQEVQVQAAEEAAHSAAHSAVQYIAVHGT